MLVYALRILGIMIVRPCNIQILLKVKVVNDQEMAQSEIIPTPKAVKIEKKKKKKKKKSSIKSYFIIFLLKTYFEDTR